MLTEALTALAAAGGTAVVEAAGKDAWHAVRDGLSALFGRGGERAARTTLERLDRTADELARTDPGEAEEVRAQLTERWQGRLADLLEDLDDGEREAAAVELRSLVALVERQRESGGGQSAGDRGLAAHTVTARADHGSLAGGVVNISGDVTLGNPQAPDPAQD